LHKKCKNDVIFVKAFRGQTHTLTVDFVYGRCSKDAFEGPHCSHTSKLKFTLYTDDAW